MKQFLLFILLFSVAIYKAQTFGDINTTGYYSQKDIEKDLDKQIKKGQKKNEISSFSKNIIGDTLIYRIQHNVDPFTLKTVFNIKDTVLQDLYCGYQEYIFDCTPCSQKHLKEFISSCGFRIISDNKYLSAYFLKTEMNVTYGTGNKDCLRISFTHIEKPKKEYKALYHSLKKK